MAPARLLDPSNPTNDADLVTAEYTIYLTPPPHQQPHRIYLLQYPNRSRTRPYNARSGVRPEEVRIKPESGYLEVDVPLNTGLNYNKYQGLKWGGNGEEGKGRGTCGMAGGLVAPRRAGGGGAGGGRGGSVGQQEDEADMELRIQNGLATFNDGRKALSTQTLGGQIQSHNTLSSTSNPHYFIGAFRGSELHLSAVSGTIQLRPQFHHLDLLSSRPSTSTSSSFPNAPTLPTSEPEKEKAKILHQSYKSTHPSQKSEFAENSANLHGALKLAAEEKWVGLEYVDEDDPEAFGVFGEKMFVQDTKSGEGGRVLRAGWGGEEFLDALSAPGRGGVGRRKKRRGGKKGDVDVDSEDEAGEGNEGG